MMRVLFEREAAGETALDHDFLAGLTVGFAALRDDVMGESWPDIVAASGISEEQIRRCAEIYIRSKATIICYGMGINQHKMGSQLAQQIDRKSVMEGKHGSVRCDKGRGRLS